MHRDALGMLSFSQELQLKLKEGVLTQERAFEAPVPHGCTPRTDLITHLPLAPVELPRV